MSISDSFILVKGQPKALLIEKLSMVKHGVYYIKYKNSPKTYPYRNSDVVILQNATWHDHLHLKVYVGGREQHTVSDVRSFNQGYLTHWRITFSNGYVRDFLHGSIRVVKSCLGDDIAKNSFEYLKRVALINELGRDEENVGILPSLYESIDFLDDSLAISPYLDSDKYKIGALKSPDLVFPFGCNASQEKAVTTAFENQISVIQGPPGTGKTQTILNIIANIVLQGKTVMVVSNNNSATNNVLDKLQCYGFGFIAAPLGKRENKEEFIQHQPRVPQDLLAWGIDAKDKSRMSREKDAALSSLRKVYKLQEEQAVIKQELNDVELEWEHFKKDSSIEEDTYTPGAFVKSKMLLDVWLQLQARIDRGNDNPLGFWRKLIMRIKWWWMYQKCKKILGVKTSFSPQNLQSVIQELQALYYKVRIKEINERVSSIAHELHSMDSKELTSRLTSLSLALLKDLLYEKYHSGKRMYLNDVAEIRSHADQFCEQYPVILSTTFSARTSIPGITFDYLIMDEASQVSIETGALALTCAKNAVIVGDTMQLPNVVTNEDRIKLSAIFDEFKVKKGFSCVEHSFLKSICAILPDVEQTLLREHYRCHPTIINFCNQRFYGGRLLIMTEDNGDENVMMAVKTVPGHHCRGHYNQREIDVVKSEVLPKLKGNEDVGIITPYNEQVNGFNKQIPNVEAATIHKYQGREKDDIIMSVVDDQITDFSDDTNLINVAISRARKRFCLVVSGNEQERHGNIAELLDYISYNNLSVSESKISSVFDYLYSHYTAERISFLKGHKKISQFDSENLTFSLIEKILSEHPEYNHLGVICHTPLRSFIRDWSLLNENERKYISHYSTHLDFLIISHVTKKPVLGIETDGYTYHNDETEQHQRDLLKNNILSVYGLPLLRLKTNESGEKEKIISLLKEVMNITA